MVIDQKNADAAATVAVEDIAFVLLDHAQITITHSLIRALQEHKAIILSCDSSHMPYGMMLPLVGHTEQSKRYRLQSEMSKPLKDHLWKVTIQAKIKNQIAVLKCIEKPYKRLEVILKRVKSGDPENIEGQAAAYYWGQYIEGFIRDQYGDPPNNLLNFGYAIIRSMVARALCSSGLHLTMGIHHSNKYNPYCLADDIMEPFRPFVDLLVLRSLVNKNLESFLTKEDRAEMLRVMTMDAIFGKVKRPLMVGTAITTSSLWQCIIGEKRKIKYPVM